MTEPLSEQEIANIEEALTADFNWSDHVQAIAYCGSAKNEVIPGLIATIRGLEADNAELRTALRQMDEYKGNTCGWCDAEPGPLGKPQKHEADCELAALLASPVTPVVPGETLGKSQNSNWEIIVDGTGGKWVTLVAVQEGAQWSAICVEMDIATCADTWTEALDVLQEVCRDVLAHGDGYEATPPAALVEYLALNESHTTYGRSLAL